MQIEGLKLFTMRKVDKGDVAVLVTQAGLLGIFYGIFNIIAHSIFLARFDVSYLGPAYAISGMAGLSFAFLYSQLKRRLKFNLLSLSIFGFILLAVLALGVMMVLEPGNGVIFTMLVLLGPLYILALMSLRESTGLLFHGRYMGNTASIIEDPAIVGAFIGSFAVPTLLSAGMNLPAIFLITSLCILVVIIIESFSVKRNPGELLPVSKDPGEVNLLTCLINIRYSRSIAIFLLASVVLLFFVQYSFLSAAHENYPGENDMAVFLGIFEGSALVFALIIKSLFSPFLIKNHGLRVAVILGPVLIAIFGLAAAISGSVQGYTPAASGFLILFLFLSVSRFLSRAFSSSVDVMVRKIFLQALAKEIRQRISSAFSGIFNEIAVIISGLLLTLAGSVVFLRLIHFAWALPLLSILWVVAGIRLYKGFRNSVNKSLQGDGSHNLIRDKTGMQSSVSAEGFQLINDYFNFTEGMISGNIESGIKTCNLLIRNAGISLDPAMIPLLRKLSQHPEKDISEAAIGALGKIDSTTAKMKGEPSYDISRGLEMVDNKTGFVNMIVASGRKLILTDLLLLIRNSDTEIKRIAIYQSGKFQVTEILPELVECLAIPALTADAYSVIRSFGEKAFQALSATFFRSSGSTEVRILIIRLFGETQLTEANEFLFPRLFSVHKLIRREALNGLLKCDYYPNPEARARLMEAVNGLIILLTRNLLAEMVVKGKRNPDLEEAISNESRWWLDFLLDLLSLIYTRAPLDRIRQELIEGTVEGRGMALEMLDIVLDDEIKPAIKTLLDSSPAKDKLKSLYRYNQVNVSSYREVIEDLINMDYNHVSVWTKSCALRSLHNFEDPDDMGFIIALLFSHHLILREEAGKFLRERNSEAWESTGYRLPESFREHLLKVITGEVAGSDELYNKVMILSSSLDGINRDHLTGLAQKLEKPVNDEFDVNDDFLLYGIPLNKGESTGIYIRWRACGLDNIPSPGSPLLNKKGFFLLRIDHIAESLFFNPGLRDGIVSLIDKING